MHRLITATMAIPIGITVASPGPVNAQDIAAAPPASDINAGNLAAQCPENAINEGSYLNNICHLTIFRKFIRNLSPKYGSAVLYRNRYLITAGHNVYQQRSRVRKIEIRCGVSRADVNSEPDFVVDDDRYFEASPNYHPIPVLKGKDFQDDFGVIKLPAAKSDALPLELAQTSTNPGDAVAIAGYPGETLYDARQLYSATGKIMGTANHAALSSYDIKTYTGNSGGPVFRIDGSGAPLAIAAIHVQGLASGGGGRRVSDDYAGDVTSLIKTIDGRTP